MSSGIWVYMWREIEDEKFDECREKCQGYLPFYWLVNLHSLETCCRAWLSLGKAELCGKGLGFQEVRVMRQTKVRSL